MRHDEAAESAERSLLGLALIRPQLIPLVRGEVGDDDWYKAANKATWDAMVSVYERTAGEGVNYQTVAAEIERSNTKAAAFVDVSYLASLDMDAPSFGQWRALASEIREQAVGRRLSTLLLRHSETARALHPPTAILELQEALHKLASESDVNHLPTAGEVVANTVEYIENLKGGLLGPTSGLWSLDLMTMGLVPGLTFLGAAPSMGKTALALQIAGHVAIREELPVLVFSLEMSARDLMQRLLSQETGVPFTAVRKGDLTEDYWARIHAAAAEISESPLYLFDAPQPTAWEIASKAHQIRAEHDGKLGLVVVDYLQLMHGSQRYKGNRNLELAEISRALKGLSMDLDVPVLCLSQLSRDGRRKGERPQLHHLRDSGAIEQDADMVAFLHREEVVTPSPENIGHAELIIAKQRNGELGTVPLAFLGSRVRFLDVSE